MKFNITKSNEIKRTIALDKTLLKNLSNTIAEILKKHNIDLGKNSYIFEPRVFVAEAKELPYIEKNSVKAFTKHVLEDFISRENDLRWEEYRFKVPRISIDGIYPKPYLDLMDKLRIVDNIKLKEIKNTQSLIRGISGNRKLMGELSEAIFPMLEEKGMQLDKGETCVFVPVVAPTPTYIQKLGVKQSLEQLNGFEPFVFAKASVKPSFEPQAGLIIIDDLLAKPFDAAAIFIDRRWTIGIPSPELIRDLSIFR
jgi:hypothetical protein